MPSKLLILQQFTVARIEDGKQIRSSKDQAIYVGMVNPTNRLAKVGDGEGTEEEIGNKKNKRRNLLLREVSRINKFVF